MLSRPSPAHSRISRGHLGRTFVVTTEGIGQAGVGWQLMRMSAARASSTRKGRSSRPPRAQFRPMLNRSAWLTLCQKASAVWPLRVRPEASVMVPETSSGHGGTPSGEELADGIQGGLGS
jgi:hypothetical protein